MAKPYPKSLFNAEQTLVKTINDYREMVRDEIRKAEMSKKTRRRMRALMGDGHFTKELMHGDFPARIEAGKIFIELLRKHRMGTTGSDAKAPESKRPRKYYLVTLCHNTGNTSDRKTEFHHSSFKQRIDRAMRRIGLNGLVVMEVQALTNYPERGNGRALMFHAHAIAWTRGDFDHMAAQEELNSSCAWQLSFGCPPVQIDPIEEDLPDDPHHIERVAYYLFKMPHDAKNVMPNNKRPGQLMLMSTIKGYRADLAVRVFECLTQLPTFKMVFGVGRGGKKLSNAWRREMRVWHKARLRETRDKVMAFDVYRLWDKFREKNGSKNFEPIKFLTGRQKPVGIVHPARKRRIS